MARIGTKPNGIHFLDVQVDDGTGQLVRKRVSCDTRDMDAAKNQRRDWMLGIHPKHPSQGGVIAPKRRGDASIDKAVRQSGLSMSKLFDMCHSDNAVWGKVKSQATIRSNINLLNKRIGDVSVVEMTRDRLKELIEELEADGYAPGSIKRKMDMVSRALRAAAEDYRDPATGAYYLKDKPRVPQIKVNNLKDRVLAPSEERMVFAAIEARTLAEPSRPWWRLGRFIRVLLDTGFRRSEALSVGPRSVAWITILDPVTAQPRRQAVLSLPRYGTKNDKPREVPLTDAIIRDLDALDAQAVGGRWFPLDASAWYMWSNIRDDVKKAGGNIDDVGLHTLRHTCLTRLARGGMQLLPLSKWAGHSDVSITAQRYAHLMTADLVGGVAMLSSNPPIPATHDSDPAPSDISNYSIGGGNRANLGTPAVH